MGPKKSLNMVLDDRTEANHKEDNVKKENDIDEEHMELVVTRNAHLVWGGRGRPSNPPQVLQQTQVNV